MFFLQKFITNALYPVPILFFLLLIALLSVKRRKMFLCLAFVWLLLLGTPLISKSLLERHARQYPIVLIPDPSVSTVVVLASTSFSSEPDVPITACMSPEGLIRIIEGIRLHRGLPHSQLWISVPDLDLSDARIALTEMSEIFGLDAKNIFAFTGARTTLEEARLFKEHSGNESVFYLVTSDYHMPRAMRSFEKKGMKPLPAPAAHSGQVRGGPSIQGLKVLPSDENLKSFRLWLHEQMGLFALRFLNKATL